MSKHVTTAEPVPLPAPYRILHDWAVCTAVYAALGALDQFRPRAILSHGEAEEMVTEALATVGVFTPPPHPSSLEPGCCTAVFVPHDPEQAAVFGVWQQCTRLPGHTEASHECRGAVCTDGQPGTVTARAAEA